MNQKLELAIQLFLFLVIVFGIIYISHGMLDNPHGFFNNKSKPTKTSMKSFSDIFKNSCNSGMKIGGGGQCNDKDDSGAGCGCSGNLDEDEEYIEEGFTGYGGSCDLRSGDNNNCWKTINPNTIKDTKCSNTTSTSTCATYDGLEFEKYDMGLGGNYYQYLSNSSENEKENVKSLIYTYPDGRGVMYKTPFNSDMKEFIGTIYRDNIDNPSTAEIMKHQLNNFNNFEFEIKGSAVGIIIHYRRLDRYGKDVSIDKKSWNIRLQTSDSNHPNGFEVNINSIVINQSNKMVTANFTKPDNVHVVGLLLKYRDETDPTPILIRSIRTTTAEGNMLLDHPYQFYLVPTGNCRTQPTLTSVGKGYCTGGTEVKKEGFPAKAWDFGNRVAGADRSLSTDKYMGWVKKAWDQCKKAEGNYVSVWHDAGAKCYKTCTPSNKGTAKIWTEKEPQDGVFQNPWNLTQRVCNSDGYYENYDKYFGIPFNTLWVLGYTNNIIPYQYRPTVVLNLIIDVNTSNITIPHISFGVRHFESDEYHSDFEIMVKGIDLHNKKGTSVVIPVAINLTPYKGKNIFPEGFCIGGLPEEYTENDYTLYIERVYGKGVSNRFKLEKSGERITQDEGFVRYNYTLGDLSDTVMGQHKILTVNTCNTLDDGDDASSDDKIACLLNSALTWIPSDMPNGHTTGHLTTRVSSRGNNDYPMYRYNLAFPINKLDPSNLQEMSIKPSNDKYTLTMWLNIPYNVSNIVFPSFTISRRIIHIGNTQLRYPNNRWFFLVININGKSSYARLQDGVSNSTVIFNSTSVSNNVGNLPQSDMVYNKGYISHFRRLENISASESVINKLKGEFFQISPGVAFKSNAGIKTLQARCSFVIDMGFDKFLRIGHSKQGGFISLIKNTKKTINPSGISESTVDKISIMVDDRPVRKIKYSSLLTKILIIRDLHWCRIFTIHTADSLTKCIFTEVYSSDNHYWIPDKITCNEDDAVTFYHTSIPLHDDVLKRVLSDNNDTAISDIKTHYLSDIQCCGTDEEGGVPKPKYKKGGSSTRIDEFNTIEWNILNMNSSSTGSD